MIEIRRVGIMGVGDNKYYLMNKDDVVAVLELEEHILGTTVKTIQANSGAIYP